MLAHKRVGSGAELLFLHGWGCDKDFFKQADNLSNFCVTRVDFFGFGESPHPSFAIDLDYFVLAVQQIMQHYNMRNVVVVGHSFGGRVAIKLAQNPRVSALILVDAAGIKPRRSVGYYAKVLTYKITKRLGKPISFGSSDYQKLSPIMKKTFVNVVNEDLTKLTKKITKPTLLVWGEKDLETPPSMLHKLEKNIKNHKTVIFERCGHFCFLQQPTRFYDLVVEFARSVLN